MHDFLSGLTSYSTGAFAFLISIDVTPWVALLGVIVLIIRIAGDFPRAITAWRELLDKDKYNDCDSK